MIMSTDNSDFESTKKCPELIVNEISSLSNSSENPLGNVESSSKEAKILEGKSLSVKPILICLATAFSGFIFGWDVGTIGGITNMRAFQEYFGTKWDPFTESHYIPKILVGVIVSIFNISCALGGLFLVKIADIQGRKQGIYASITIYSLGTLVSWTCGPQWWYMFCARFIAGLGVGATAVMVPMFISESAPVKIRGAMVVFYQLMITLGILMGNIINYSCKRTLHVNDNSTWKIPLGLGNIWAVIVVIGVHFMPESPVFLINQMGNAAMAKQSFAKMNNLNIEDPKVNEHILKLVLNHENAKEISNSSRNTKLEFVFGEPKLGLRLFIGIMVMAFQQLSGANYFFYYGTALFNSIGIEDSYITSILLSSVNFVSTFLGVYLVEKLGRKACLVLGSIGMFISMSIYASVGSFLLQSNATTAGIVMIIFTCVYITFFACTSGPVSFVVISELFPARTKAISMAVCTSVNWICNFLISLCTPYVTEIIGFKFGYVFACFLFISIWFFIFMLKETKNKNIDEVDAMYANIDTRD